MLQNNRAESANLFDNLKNDINQQDDYKDIEIEEIDDLGPVDRIEQQSIKSIQRSILTHNLKKPSSLKQVTPDLSTNQGILESKVSKNIF